MIHLDISNAFSNTLGSIVRFVKRVTPKDIRYPIVTASVVLILFDFYFGYKLITGNGGVMHYKELKTVRDKKTHLLKKIINQNEEQKKEIDLIHNAATDVEFLDELARIKLNYSKKSERLIIIQEKTPS